MATGQALRRRAAALAAAALVAACGPAAASASADAAAIGLLRPGDSGLRDDLGWLVDRRVLSLPLGTWPLPAATLRAALERVDAAHLTPLDADALRRVERALRRDTTPLALTAGVNSGRHPALDGEPAVRGTAQAGAGLRVHGERWSARLQLGALADPLARPRRHATLAGSHVALELPDAVLAFGAVDRWWGPGRFASPVLSDAAPPFPALLLRRSLDEAPHPALLRWIGPWGYEISLGELQDYHPAHTRTLGLRLYARPREGLEIGLSRHILWGGAGRPRDASALIDALLARSNIDPGDPRPDPSDELAGLDVRLSGPTARGGAWAGWLQLIGEDEARKMPTKLIATAGARLTLPWHGGRLAWTLESGDTRLGRVFGLHGKDDGPAYLHGTYVDGYYHQGLPIGGAIGGDGRLTRLRVDWVPACAAPGCRRYALTVFSGRTSEHGAQPLNRAFGASGALRGGSVSMLASAGAWRWSLGLSVQHQPGGDRPDLSLQAAMEWTPTIGR